MSATVGISASVIASMMPLLADSGSTGLLILLNVVMVGLVSTSMSGPQVALLSELFETRVRYTGVAATYQTATVLAAGFSPLVVSLLAAAGLGAGNVIAAAVAIVLSMLGLIAMTTTRETRGTDLNRSTMRVTADASRG